MKRLISLFLAAVLSLCCLNFAPFAMADGDYDYFIENRLPYVDADGVYHRTSNGEYIAFETDYIKALKDIQGHFLNHKTSFSVSFASSDKEYAYTASAGDTDEANRKANEVWNKMFRDVFTAESLTLGSENAGAGDYLFNSLNNVEVAPAVYYSFGDDPAPGNVRYYTYTFYVSNVNYISSLEWERAVRSFAEQFSSTYLDSNMNDYDKVKCIYDFVVRNTDYDYEVFSGKYNNTTRYNIAHSAYGALYGKLLSDGKTPDDANLNYKLTATGEKVIYEYDQGLAVCEGYSKLFYYLCSYNGIPCRIVDGDNDEYSGKESDPHEWNYVYLDDGTGDGYLWYQVDATFASSKSYKEVDLNSYDYFLRGTENANFSSKMHQQPYYTGMEPYYNPASLIKPQLYYWDDAECAASKRDYRFRAANISVVEGNAYSIIFKRVTDYGGDVGVRTSFIYTDLFTSKRIELDVDENNEKSVYFTDSDGFIYNGHLASYEPIVSYMLPEEYVADTARAIDVRRDENGRIISYPVNIYGADNSSFTAGFKITPLDMSNSSPNNYDFEEFQRAATYMAKDLIPTIIIKDSFDKELNDINDYDLVYYNSANQVVSAPNEVGKYKVNVVFKGNYKGTYVRDFEVEKINLSLLNDNSVFIIPYRPKAALKQNGITGPHDYITTYSAYGVKLTSKNDITASSNGSLEYGASGFINITGKATSPIVLSGAENSRNIPYKVSGKFDITTIGFKAADTNTVNKHYYTGSEIKPTKFDAIDSVLERGVDYKIVSYSNNVNPGIAYVTIEGINGCEGRLTLPFVINKKTDNSDSSGSNSGSGTDSGNSGNKTVKITLYGSKLSKVVAGKKSFTAKWKSVKGDVTGYQLQYSTSKKFTKATTKTVTVKGAKKTSYTVKKLKAKKKYYVRIRTYYTYNKTKYTTKWSAAKAVTTKK